MIQEEEKVNLSKLKKGKTYVFNYLDEEWVYMKIEELTSSYLVGPCVFSGRDSFLTRGEILIEKKDIVDFREATKMEDYFFLHHYNAINYKRFVFARLDDVVNSDKMKEVKKEAERLKFFLDI